MTFDEGGRRQEGRVTLQELPDNVLTCKATWTHPWDTNPSPEHVSPYWSQLAYRVVCWRCPRCFKEKYEYWNENGYRITPPKIWTPDGYPRTQRYKTPEMRREIIRRGTLAFLFVGREERRTRRGRQQ